MAKSTLRWLLAVMFLHVTVTRLQADDDHDYELWTIKITSRTQLRGLQLTSERLDLDWWTLPSLETEGVLLVVPQQNREMEAAMQRLSLSHRVVHHNVSAMVDHEVGKDHPTRHVRSLMPNEDIDAVWHESYHDYHEMRVYLHNLADNNPSIMRVATYGRSLEGRPLLYVHLHSNTTTSPNDNYRIDGRSIVLECGIHAREWISSAVCLSILSRLVHEENHLLVHIDWYFLPMTNPDGYEFTRGATNVSSTLIANRGKAQADTKAKRVHARFWRKNRRTTCASDGPTRNKQHIASTVASDASIDELIESATNHTCCIGVDLNRNFNWKWANQLNNDNAQFGCPATYPGARAFSEPETEAIRQFMWGLGRSHCVAYIALHSFGQQWVLPTRHSSTRMQRLNVSAVARSAVNAVRVLHGSNYTVGDISQLFVGHTITGSSMDWVAASTNVPYSYGIELPPAKLKRYQDDDFDYFGFVVNPVLIKPIGREILMGLDVISAKAAQM